MKVYFAAVVAAVVAIALQVRAEPERAPNTTPEQQSVARQFPGPIVNGQRRQPTPREISERLRAAMLEAAEADAARRDAEIEEIFKTLNMPQAR